MNAENTQRVQWAGERVVVLLPHNSMTPEQAVRHACHLIDKASLPLSYVIAQLEAICKH